MHNPRHARFALLIALVVFGGLATIMMNAGGLQEEQIEEKPSLFHVQLDARGDLGALAYDHVLVQDTLSYYAGKALPEGQNASAHWEMNYCCDDPTLYAEGDEIARIYQWWGDFAFSDPASFAGFLKEMLASDHIEIDRFQIENGTLIGIASAQLPIPGATEGIIQLDEVRFNLRTISA